MESTTRRLADAHGRELHVCEWAGDAAQGALPPIILLHDSLGSVELWRDFPAMLARLAGARVIAYDRAGFGRSAPRQAPPASGFIAGEAQASLLPLMDALDIGRAVLFGHSVGGGMAVCAAAQYPSRVAAVITESAQAFVEERTLAGIRAARKNFADPAQLARLAKYHGNDLGQAQWVLDAWTETWLAPAFAGWSLDDALRRLQCPVLAMHGDQDEFGSELHPRRIAELPSAFGGQGRHVLLAGCGHVPHREQAQRVLEIVTGFLRGLLDGSK